MSLPDTTVKYYDSTMTGAPTCTGQVNKLVLLLDACLQDGFGTVTLSTLVVAGNVATAYVAGGHNLGGMIGGLIGPVIRIAGASITEGDHTGLNRDWRVSSIADSTHFTFVTEGIGNQTASGTITAARAPAGWTKVYSGTNKGGYRANAIAGNRLYLRVSDAGAGSSAYARVLGYESMSDVDTGTNGFPTETQFSGGLYVHKSNGTTGATHPWRLWADHAAFYFVCNPTDEADPYTGLFFGDSAAPVSPDPFSAGIIGDPETTPGAVNYIGKVNTATAHYMARRYTNTGGAVQFKMFGHGAHTSGIGSGDGYTWPMPRGAGVVLAPCEISENSNLRGLMPGLLDPAVAFPAAPTGGTVLAINSGPLAGRVIYLQSFHYAGASIGLGAIDLTGPWR